MVGTYGSNRGQPKDALQVDDCVPRGVDCGVDPIIELHLDLCNRLGVGGGVHVEKEVDAGRANRRVAVGGDGCKRSVGRGIPPIEGGDPVRVDSSQIIRRLGHAAVKKGAGLILALSERECVEDGGGLGRDGGAGIDCRSAGLALPGGLVGAEALRHLGDVSAARGCGRRLKGRDVGRAAPERLTGGVFQALLEAVWAATVSVADADGFAGAVGANSDNVTRPDTVVLRGVQEVRDLGAVEGEARCGGRFAQSRIGSVDFRCGLVVVGGDIGDERRNLVIGLGRQPHAPPNPKDGGDLVDIARVPIGQIGAEGGHHDVEDAGLLHRCLLRLV